jgi:outer membrane protein, multidrug efflux system
MMGAAMRATFVCITFASLLAGCAGGPAYQRPDVALPAQWQAGTGSAAVAPTAWWREFQSTELDRLIGAALENNRDLKAAAARLMQARALAQVAGADRWPSVAVNADVVRERDADGKRSTTISAGLGAAIELDLWGKNRQSHDAALGRVRSSVHAQQAVKLTLQAEVATTYFQVLSSLDRITVASETLRNTEAVLRLLQTQHRSGAVSGLEVARQQGLVASVRADIEPLEQQRQQAQAALAVLLGRHVQELSLAATPLGSIQLPSVAAGLPSTLLERRPDIQQAEADLGAAHADLNAARAALFPSLQLSAAGGVASASLGALLRSANPVYTLAAGLTAPIFDGGRLRGQVAFADARQDELLQTYQHTILSALREVETSLTAVHRLGEQSVHQQAVLAHAGTALRLAELRYRNGAVDFGTVLDAQRVLLAARAAQEATTFARYAAAVALYRALGGSADAAAPAPMVVSTTALR